MSSAGSETLQTLLSNREEILEVLLNSSYTRRDLLERVEYSESTLDRGLRSLEDASLVTYVDGTWQITQVGRCAYRQYNDYSQGLTYLAKAAPLLRSLPVDNPISKRFLIGAETIEADTVMPNAALSRISASIKKANNVRVVVPKLLIASINQFYDTVANDESSELELFFTTEAFERLKETNTRGIKEKIQNQCVSLYHGVIPFSFGLWIAGDEEVGLIVYTERGVRGLLINDTDEALSWAVSQFEQVIEQADSAVI